MIRVVLAAVVAGLVGCASESSGVAKVCVEVDGDLVDLHCYDAPELGDTCYYADPCNGMWYQASPSEVGEGCSGGVVLYSTQCAEAPRRCTQRVVQARTQGGKCEPFPSACDVPQGYVLCADARVRL